MGDPSYLPLLRKATREHPHDNESVNEARLSIAKLGHAQLIPFPASVIRSSHQDDHGYATIALSFTASRDAVPILIDWLPGPDTRATRRG